MYLCFSVVHLCTSCAVQMLNLNEPCVCVCVCMFGCRCPWCWTSWKFSFKVLRKPAHYLGYLFIWVTKKHPRLFHIKLCLVPKVSQWPFEYVVKSNSNAEYFVYTLCLIVGCTSILNSSVMELEFFFFFFHMLTWIILPNHAGQGFSHFSAIMPILRQSGELCQRGKITTEKNQHKSPTLSDGCF